MNALGRREREKQELRTKILDAARELFVAEGYDSVTMRKIAERIEYSPTAIYLHFKDKTALIRELCENDFRAFAAKFFDLLALPDPVERLRRAGDAYVDFAVECPQQYRLMFMTKRPEVDPEEGERDDPALNAYVFLKGTIEQAMAAGLLRPELTDADLVAQTTWAGMHGVVSLEIAVGAAKEKWIDWAPLRERARLMNDTLLRGFLREPSQVGSPRSPQRKGRTRKERR
jgi:AcrR family transcriptional regulator